MSYELNLKEIERRAYMSYHEDGLIDIAIGFVMLSWAILLLFEPKGLIALLGPIAFAIWYLGKRFITIPRIGVIEPSQKMGNRMKRLSLFLLFFGIIVLAGILLAQVSGNAVPGFRSLSMLGLVIASGVAVVAYLLNAVRLYVYAAILFIAFAGGEALADIISGFDAFLLSVILAGAFILVSGLVVLARFLRRYPLPVMEV